MGKTGNGKRGEGGWRWKMLELRYRIGMWGVRVEDKAGEVADKLWSEGVGGIRDGE